MFDKKFFEGEIKNSSFLITGGAGFIGSNIAEYLLKYGAEKVRVLDNLSTGFFENIESFISFSNFEFINGDIRNLEDCKKACDGIDFVLHQAALGSVPRSIENPIATNGSNIDGFLNMLVAAKDSTVKRFVYASSSSVYGDSPILPKSEDEIGAPLSPYAVTKYVNELYAAVFFKTYRLEVIGLRYFNIFGPRQNPKGAYAAAIPLFMDAILSNKSPYINGDGEQSRDFTFVENAVQANIKSIFTKDTMAIGEVFNIACGDRITINELFQMLKDYSGSSVSAEYREPRAGDIKDSLADISKAKKMLEYSPEFGVKEGLQITLDWFKSKFY
jgi:UDP-N-acetylglucosamine 4-epimerase